jgi:hypothetical protein
VRRLSFLRSYFCIAFVSILVLTGFVHEAYSDCHERTEPGQVEQGEQGGQGEQAPMDGDDCQCICHQVFANLAAAPARVDAGAFVVQMRFIHADEFPPDTEPQGIDYPPQLV